VTRNLIHATKCSLPGGIDVCAQRYRSCTALIAIVCCYSGAHAVLMRLWGEKVGPCMQLLHFAWALGAFFAPLISKPFISEEGDGANGGNNLFQVSNLSCFDLHLHFNSDAWNDTQDFGSGGLPNVYNYNNTNCLEFLNNTCLNLMADSNLTMAELSSVILGDLTNCSNLTTTQPVGRYLLGWPYWISASFFILRSR